MEKCGVVYLVRWEPLEVINSAFPAFEAEDFYQKMCPIWIDLDLGKLSEDEAISQFSLTMYQ